ncbi:MAG: hypothetical protein F6K56_23885 [Moorea sp. SIO3G5]|nr:hypothetical protein [Moorena sp. SIO3G5]
MSIRYATWNIEQENTRDDISKKWTGNGGQKFLNFVAAVIQEYSIDIISIIEVPPEYSKKIVAQLKTVCRNLIKNTTWESRFIPCTTDDTQESIIFLYNTSKVSLLLDTNGNEVYGYNVISKYKTVVKYPDNKTSWQDVSNPVENDADIFTKERGRRPCFIAFKLEDNSILSCIAYHAPSTDSHYGRKGLYPPANVLYNQSYGLYLCGNSFERDKIFEFNASAQLKASISNIVDRVEERINEAITLFNHPSPPDTAALPKLINDLRKKIYTYILFGKIYYPYLEGEEYNTLTTKVNSELTKSTCSILVNFLTAYNLKPFDLANSLLPHNQQGFKCAVTYYCVARIFLIQEIMAVASQGVVSTATNEFSNQLVHDIYNTLDWPSLDSNQLFQSSSSIRNLARSLAFEDSNIGDLYNFYGRQFYNDDTIGSYPEKTTLSCDVALVSGDFNLPYQDSDSTKYSDHQYDVINNQSGYRALDASAVVANNNENTFLSFVSYFDKYKEKPTSSVRYRYSDRNIDNIFIHPLNEEAQENGQVIDLVADIQDTSDANTKRNKISQSAFQFFKYQVNNNEDVMQNYPLTEIFGAFRLYREFISDHLPVMIDISLPSDS